MKIKTLREGIEALLAMGEDWGSDKAMERLEIARQMDEIASKMDAAISRIEKNIG